MLVCLSSACARTTVPQHVCGGQRASWFFPSTLWALRFELSLSDLEAYSFSHLAIFLAHKRNFKGNPVSPGYFFNTYNFEDLFFSPKEIRGKHMLNHFSQGQQSQCVLSIKRRLGGCLGFASVVDSLPIASSPGGTNGGRPWRSEGMLDLLLL